MKWSVNRNTNIQIWKIVGVAVVGLVAFVSIRQNQPSAPKDYVLPNDNFDTATKRQLWMDLNQYNVSQTPQDHEVYVLTGGLGVADPRIMGWDSGGNMDFAANNSAMMYDFREFGQDPSTWTMAIPKGPVTSKNAKTNHFAREPVRWIKHYTKSGGVYYKMDDPTQAPQYYFKEGATYIFVVDLSYSGMGFPQGAMTHLVPLGNPLAK